MQRKSILKDTIQLTVVRFFWNGQADLLNVWLTHRIGVAIVGIVAFFCFESYLFPCTAVPSFMNPCPPA